ncbi:MAG: hypothetical protein R2754_03300 [Microthrixaceae bacterium]
MSRFGRMRAWTVRHRVPAALGMAVLLAGSVTAILPSFGGAEEAAAAPNVSGWDETAMDAWEVVGLNDRSDIVWPVPVWAFAEVGNRVFVGGRFTQVRRGPGYTAYDQPFLAAFDRDSGEWIDTFRPEIENGVYALSASPDGTRLLVGGEFTNINGAPNTSGLAALDPISGQVDPGWSANVTNTDGVNSVKEIITHGSDVYIGGEFTHVQGAAAAPTRQYRVSKLAGATGAVDTSFDVRAGGGKVWALAIPPDGSRLYLGGFFSAVNGATDTQWFAAVDLATGRNVIPNPDPHTHSRDWVFDLAATNDHVYVAGENHRMWVHDASDLNLSRYYITNGYGGDYQALSLSGNRLMTGGHFHGWEQEYHTETRGTLPNPQFGQVQWVSAWDTDTARPTFGFTPRLNMSEGVWALMTDSAGKLWVGGDPTTSGNNSTRGFAVFPLADPQQPANLARDRSATQSSTSGTELRWRNQTAASRCPQSSHGLAGAALDGKVAGGLWECSTSHTTRETNPWWQVDLGASHDLDLLRVSTMWGDDSATGVPFRNELDDARVYLSDTPLTGNNHAELAAKANGWISLGAPFSGTQDYTLEGVAGRYVRIVAWGPNRTLNLPEVELFDLPGDAPPADTFRSFGDTWAFNDTGVEAPGWAERDFNDAGWPTGAGQLGFGDGDEGTVTASGVLTTYARGTFQVADPGALTSLLINVIRDDGAAVYVNGHEVGRDNLPAGPLSAGTYASSGVWGAAESEPVGFLVNPAILVPGQNTLAIEVHNTSVNGADISLDAQVLASDQAPPPPPDPEPETLVASGDEWRINASGVEQSGWSAPGFNDAGWAAGPTQFGFGDGDEATVTQSGVLTTYARTTFVPPDAGSIAGAQLAVIRDDGAAVYLNGTEVWRSNLPAGQLTADTYATQGVWGTDERDPTLVPIDPALLNDGTNTLAVEVHNNTRSGGDLSFDAELTVTR